MSKIIFKEYFKRLTSNYTKKFVILMACFYPLLKGFVNSAIDLSLLPFLKNTLMVNEKTYQIYIILIWTPWSIKAFMGSISDLYPLFGYHKMGYMLISSIIGSISMLFVGTIPFNEKNRIYAPFLLFLVMVEISMIDLFCESKYAKEMKNKTKKQGSDAVSFVWGCVTVGSFIASTFVGVFTDFFNAQYIYLICFPILLQILFPIVNNYMGEKYISAPNRKFDLAKLKKNFNIFFLALSMAILAIGMALVTLFFSSSLATFYAILSSIILIIILYHSQDLKKAKCNIYLFLIEATYVQIPGALDYWYTSDSTCVQNGPNFDMTYYLTYTKMVSSVAGIAAIIIFQLKMSGLKFRRSFLLSSIIRIFASVFDIFIVSRLNIKIGVPDKVAYLLGDALVLSTASMLAIMPAIMLTAKIVDDGLESTTYAILAGFQNFGMNVSKSIGLLLMNWFKIDADSRPCNFKHLSLLIFVCHFLFPLIPIFLLNFFIEDETLDSSVLSKETKKKIRNEDYHVVHQQEVLKCYDLSDDVEDLSGTSDRDT